MRQIDRQVIPITPQILVWGGYNYVFTKTTNTGYNFNRKLSFIHHLLTTTTTVMKSVQGSLSIIYRFILSMYHIYMQWSKQCRV